MIFEIDNVELSFSNKKILNGVYLKAETGKVTGILGSNGCGKSCLLQIAFGSLASKYKLIRIDKIPIIKPLYKTGKVKLLPQFTFIPNIFKIFKAFQLYEVNWNHFISEFKSFEKYGNSRMRNLSGGERRLIEIYITLKSNSEIIMLDEPFSHLSPLYIEKVISLIEEEKQQKCIIVTDHMYLNILNVSDTLYFMKNGNTKLINDPKELEDYGYLSAGSLD